MRSSARIPASSSPTAVLCDAAAVDERRCQRDFTPSMRSAPGGYGKLRSLPSRTAHTVHRSTGTRSLRWAASHRLLRSGPPSPAHILRLFRRNTFREDGVTAFSWTFQVAAAYPAHAETHGARCRDLRSLRSPEVGMPCSGRLWSTGDGRRRQSHRTHAGRGRPLVRRRAPIERARSLRVAADALACRKRSTGFRKRSPSSPRGTGSLRQPRVAAGARAAQCGGPAPRGRIVPRAVGGDPLARCAWRLRVESGR